jgi:hypothetical protein
MTTNTGQVRQHIIGIQAMCERLLTEAAHKGVNSEAAMLNSKTANPEAWRQRRRYGYLDNLADRLGDNHPMWVLGTWDLLIIEHLNHAHRTQQVTLETAAAYIKTNLTDLARDDEFPFKELADDIRHCHEHLEDVLRDGDRPEKGAPCPACGGPALVKEYGSEDELDMWVCPSARCHQVWRERDYRTMIDGIYVEVADWLTGVQIEAKYRVRAGTVRQWANRGEVQKRKTHEGQTEYDVASVLRMRDTAPSVDIPSVTEAGS